MSVNQIDAQLCAAMFLAGAHSLEHAKDWINELNVFPVPDGDTGTNMTMTIKSAADEVMAQGEVTMASLCKAMSSGSLRGARGNSGVILSQLLRGFCKVIREYDLLDSQILCKAFQRATETAYKAVMKPKEGTILTVAKGFSEEAAALLEADPQIELEAFFSGALIHAQDVLSRTPEMLPVLKEAGVVDSGGQGLIEILQGAFDLFTGKTNVRDLTDETEEENAPVEQTVVLPPVYCIRFSLQPFAPEDVEAVSKTLRAALTKLPDIEGFDVKVKPEELQVHAHSLHPGTLIEEAVALGVLKEVHVHNPDESACPNPPDGLPQEDAKKEAQESALLRENDSIDAASFREQTAERKDVGFVAVAAGEGLCSIFRDLGADRMIEGGQTMNPSTEDVINAIRSTNADTVFVFPNNKNIILAASQAQSMIEDVKVVVIPTKTIPQGISALIGYAPDLSAQENEQMMLEEIEHVQSCSITYAVRDTHIAGKDIHEGDIMGVGDTGILAVGKDLFETTLESVKAMVTEESELISVYYGEDITAEDAHSLAGRLREMFPECEVELSEGGQPIYYYILSVE